MHQGRVVFGAIEEVVFGHPAAGAIVAQMDRLGTSRAFLMVSGTLNRQTDEITKIREALGARCAGLFDAMPAHTPREAVIAATQAARGVCAGMASNRPAQRPPSASLIFVISSDRKSVV